VLEAKRPPAPPPAAPRVNFSKVSTPMLRILFSLLLGFSAVLLGVNPALADGDKAKGEKTFAKCKACHSLDAGKNGVGPSLSGVVGRKSGTGAGFKYSQPMIDKAVVWNKENLEKYLKDPKGFVPGNKMIFAGLKGDEADDVIAYLQSVAK
jgi:cytochrome c